MNQNITETEQLLNSIGMSIMEVQDIIKKGVANRFKSMVQLWGYDTVEDLSQNLMLYYIDLLFYYFLAFLLYNME